MSIPIEAGGTVRRCRKCRTAYRRSLKADETA